MGFCNVSNMLIVGSTAWEGVWVCNSGSGHFESLLSELSNESIVTNSSNLDHKVMSKSGCVKTQNPAGLCAGLAKKHGLKSGPSHHSISGTTVLFT